MARANRNFPRLAAVSCAVATVVLLVAGVPWPVAILAGAGGFVIGRLLARRAPTLAASVATNPIDPFTVGEPWRQFVQGALRSADKLDATVNAASDGPIKSRLESIVGRLRSGIDETWRIAQRGDQIDETVRRLDPVALRSKLDSLNQRNQASPSADLEAAITSVESQLASTQRLKDESTKTADTLRLAQTRFDELVTRAAEVSVGAADTEAYENDVDELVIELESLRLAVEETRGS